MSTLLAMLAGTVAFALPAPDLDKASIGVVVGWRGVFGDYRLTAEAVYFVRIDENTTDFESARSVIKSNYRQGHQVYLLNVKPGRYVAVAAEMSGVGRSTTDRYGNAQTLQLSLTAFFPESMIAQTEVTVEPGELSFMGKYLGHCNLEEETPDRIQKHFFVLLQLPEDRWDQLGEMKGPMSSFQATRIVRSSKSEIAFWSKAQKKAFKEHPAWSDLIRCRLDALR